jgi:predicted ribosomally synthesized peptide with nif11-like leader
MANDNARALIDRMTSDEAFRNRVTGASDLNAKKAILADAGYGDVTPEQVQAAGAGFGVELSDAELEAVAGGRAVEWALVGATVVLAAATAA